MVVTVWWQVGRAFVVGQAVGWSRLIKTNPQEGNIFVSIDKTFKPSLCFVLHNPTHGGQRDGGHLELTRDAPINECTTLKC